MTLPAAPTKRQLGVQMKQANGTCAALVLCYSGTAGNPLPEDTNLSVFTNQVILHATWARSQREAYGDFSYELVVGTTREQVADGCTVSQLLHTTRKPRQKRQILNNGGQGAQAIVVYRQPSCDSPRFCSANINLAHFGLLPNREYHVNVFIAFHGVRLAYSASSFCFSIGQSCTISSSIPTSSTSVSTSTSSTTAVSTYERGKLTSQFSDVVLTELRQGGPKSALFTTFALSLPASSGLHVALYIYSCTNSTRGTVTVYQRNAVGRSHLGNQERRFASFVLATKASKDLVRVMYVPKEPNVTDLPLLRLNALYYDNSSRHKLPPLANRTLLRVSGASAGGQCAVTLDLAFNCSSRNLQCSELNEQNVYYRLLRTPHSSRVPSCVPTSSSSGKPLDSKALKLLPVARVSGPGGKRGGNGKAYRLWNYQATLSVEAGARRRYYVQLFWRVISTDSFIPFSESTFRLGRDCQVPAGGWRAKRKVA